MRVRLLVAAFAGLSFAAAAVAEPAKAPVQKAGQPADRPVELVVASADTVRAAEVAETQPDAPAKRERKARVTTCRCGDQPPNN